MKYIKYLAILVCICCLAFKSVSISSKENFVTDSTVVKKIFLLRHAKSSHENSKLIDFDRPLNDEGKQDAGEMGDYIARSGEQIELIVASPSVRTRETAAIICKKINYDLKLVKWDSTIYACTAEALLNCIKKTDKKYKSVLYIGHNNSMTHVVNMIQKDIVIADMPTCGLVGIRFRESEWNDSLSGRIMFYKTPKQ